MQRPADGLCAHFERVALLADCYTSFAAKMSKHRNPINDVGVTEVYGIDDPKVYQGDQLAYVKEHTMIPQKHIDELKGFERFLFAKLYAGGFSKKPYRLFEYRKNQTSISNFPSSAAALLSGFIASILLRSVALSHTRGLKPQQLSVRFQ